MDQTAVFTGGGSAGHVTPNIALMQRLQQEGWHIHYIGTEEGIEHELIGGLPGIPYHTLSAGKLRRYFSIKNLFDVFKVIKGIGQAHRIMGAIKPDVLFSKGGFVSVPVVVGTCKTCPIVLHESDYSPGLSNRIAGRYATKICATFEDTVPRLKGKGVFTGTPIRGALYGGDAKKGFAFTGLKNDKPVLLMMGGSLGAQAVNDALREALPELLKTFYIVHLCGKGKISAAHERAGYVQYEYVDAQLPDVFAMADIILSRAGANAIFEFLALKKPALLVPLPLSASRGDQIQNANYFKKKGYAEILSQEDITAHTLTAALNALYTNRAKYIAAMEQADNTDGTDAVLNVIKNTAKYNRGRNKV